mgnify:CR=1 FL=1
MKENQFRALEMSSFEVSDVLARVLSNLSGDQLNLLSLAARNKVCTIFLEELLRAEKVKNA